jgi:hypothetical protein
VSLVAIAREEFESLLGHLRDLLERNLGMRLLLCIPIVSLLSNEEVGGASLTTFPSFGHPTRSLTLGGVVDGAFWASSHLLASIIRMTRAPSVVWCD